MGGLLHHVGGVLGLSRGRYQCWTSQIVPPKPAISKKPDTPGYHCAPIEAWRASEGHVPCPRAGVNTTA